MYVCWSIFLSLLYFCRLSSELININNTIPMYLCVPVLFPLPAWDKQHLQKVWVCSNGPAYVNEEETYYSNTVGMATHRLQGTPFKHWENNVTCTWLKWYCIFAHTILWIFILHVFVDSYLPSDFYFCLIRRLLFSLLIINFSIKRFIKTLRSYTKVYRHENG